MSELYPDLLRFPERAEYLGQRPYRDYRVHLEHWQELSQLFRDTFKKVYTRGSSAVLLIHGTQGTGKTLFSERLLADFERTRRGDDIGQRASNLWYTLVTDEPGDRAVLTEATQKTHLVKLEAEPGWLERERQAARRDTTSAVRIFILDDAHKDAFLREWAELGQPEYAALRKLHGEDFALDSIAQRIVSDCRGPFQRSIFLFLSNRAELMNGLRAHMDTSHGGLAMTSELPLPKPELKEAIVRMNTNSLNHVSYWYCLDQAGPQDKQDVYRTLKSDSGFVDSFRALDRAFGSKRVGRPANKNLLTLVTLGADPASSQAFKDDKELEADEHYYGLHHAVWSFRGTWASSLLPKHSDENTFRRMRMVESEFNLRWVSLDLRATHALLSEDAPGSSLGQQILDVICFFPSVGASPQAVSQQRLLSERIDEQLDPQPAAQDFERFSEEFARGGQSRSQIYEQALTRRLTRYGRGFRDYPQLRPDYIVNEYTPCAITAAASDAPEVINAALRRSCHVLEFTAHLRPGLAGLDDYVLSKLANYAEMLESV